MLFLTNPRKRRKTVRRKGRARLKKGSAAAKRFMASIRPNPHRGGTVAKRRRTHRNPRRRHRRNAGLVVPLMNRRGRRRHRRNPFGISTGGIMGQLKRGATNGLGVLIGRVGSRALPDLTGISGTIAGSSMGSSVSTAALAGAQLASGIIVAMLAKAVGGGELGAMIVAGAFDGVYEDIATSFSGTIPVVGQYLGGYSSTLPSLAQAAVRGYSNPRVAGYGAAATRAATGGGGNNRGSLRRIGIGGGRVAR